MSFRQFDLSWRECYLTLPSTREVLTLNIVKRIRMERSADIAESPMDAAQEASVPISWHMLAGKPKFMLEIDLYNISDNERWKMFDTLMSWMETRQLFTFSTEFGSYTTCVIAEIGAEGTSDSYNVWNGEVTIQQLKVISSRIAYFFTLYDENNVPAGGTPAISNGLTVILPALTESEEDEEYIKQLIEEAPPIIII